MLGLQVMVTSSGNLGMFKIVCGVYYREMSN